VKHPIKASCFLRKQAKDYYPFGLLPFKFSRLFGHAYCNKTDSTVRAHGPEREIEQRLHSSSAHLGPERDEA
jgi:hypothetical protein